MPGCALLLLVLGRPVDATPMTPQTISDVKIHQTATASDSPVSVDLSIDLNRSGAAHWLGLTPSATYVINGHWSVEAGLPVFAVNGAMSQDGASHAGLGDVYGTVYLDLSTERTTFYTSGTMSAPTGRVSDGLGFGQVTWQWSNYVERSVGRVTPYADGGLSNGLDLESRVNRIRPGLRGNPPAPVIGRIVDGEGGVTLD